MKLNILVRKIKNDEVDACITLFQETVHCVNVKDYTIEQLNAWAPLGEPHLVDNHSYWESLLKNISYVAEYNNSIVGFGDLTREGYLDRLFIHKDFQNYGVATAIVNNLEEEAKKHGIKEITTHASITAKSFFEKRGFVVVKEQQWPIRGVKLTNFVMKKLLD